MVDLFTNRDVTADWHVEQARRLLEIALNQGSATALVYAALEGRNAIERLVFEMSMLATGGKFTPEQLRTAQRKDGVFELLAEALNKYRRHIEFRNLCMEVLGTPLRFPVPDIRRCKRLRADLNPYCHCQLEPQVTVRNKTSDWFVSGTTAVKETCDFLDPLLSAPQGVLQLQTMPVEIREIFEAYVAGNIDAGSTRTRLDIMRPVLDERLLQQGR